MVVLTCSRAKSAKGRGILNILGNKWLYTWAKRTKIYFRRRKKKIGNTNWVHTKGNKIYFGVQDYDSVLFDVPSPPHFGLYFSVQDYDSVLFSVPSPLILVYLPSSMQKCTDQNIL